MTQFEPGDLVLLAFPFTGATGAKQRPALVLLDSGDEDLLVARVTTQRRVSEFDMVIHSWSVAGLVRGARGSEASLLSVGGGRRQELTRFPGTRS
jgi:mRNA interferase MazF